MTTSTYGGIPHAIDWSDPDYLAGLSTVGAKIRVDLDEADRMPSAQRRVIEKRALDDLADVLLKIDAATVRQELADGKRALLPTRITKAHAMTTAERLQEMREEAPGGSVAKRTRPWSWL